MNINCCVSWLGLELQLVMNSRSIFKGLIMFLEIEFKEGETQHFVEIEVLFDGVREMREAFTVHLKPDENMVAEIQVINSCKVINNKIW